MGQLVGNLGLISTRTAPAGSTITTTVHRQRGVTNMVSFSVTIHHGANNFNASLPESTDIGSVYDVIRYAKEPGHTTRDGTFDAKMAAVWGTAYSGLASTYKDDLFSALRGGEVIPPPP